MLKNSEAIITNFYRDYLFRPSLSWGECEFKRRSYSRWAAIEILNRVIDRPFDHPVTVIEDFILEMYCYSADEDRAASFIFQTAIETAEEIAMLFVQE